ncbi:peptidyl-prolyl cis-trans isomerase FKBP14 isoform X2 [Anolis carolinensis]|uniref:peptidyl-prolyl cis-trans isomerase FKBP14 isoform X2 n=1 Tax=Anolis carolinensis TaxID=28377 RepID=UPI002F2B2F36
MMEGAFWALLAFAVLALGTGALIPEPEVKLEVLQKPFICKRKTKLGDMLLVHYEGFLEKDGSLFHSTHKHNNGQPTWFTLGIKEVIPGWDKGLTEMCIGEKRKLVIPPSLGYGKEGKGNFLQLHQPIRLHYHIWSCLISPPLAWLCLSYQGPELTLHTNPARKNSTREHLDLQC